MNVMEFLKENKSSMRVGLPIELRDLIDDGSVYDGSYEGMVEFLGRPGLEHVRNARYIMEDIDNGENKIVLLYIKDIKEYDDDDLKRFAVKMIRMEREEVSLEDKSLDEKLNEAKEKCSLTENEFGNDKDKDVEVLKE